MELPIDEVVWVAHNSVHLPRNFEGNRAVRSRWFWRCRQIGIVATQRAYSGHL